MGWGLGLGTATGTKILNPSFRAGIFYRLYLVKICQKHSNINVLQISQKQRTPRRAITHHSNPLLKTGIFTDIFKIHPLLERIKWCLPDDSGAKATWAW